jgi:hypothetical protein
MSDLQIVSSDAEKYYLLLIRGEGTFGSAIAETGATTGSTSPIHARDRAAVRPPIRAVSSASADAGENRRAERHQYAERTGQQRERSEIKGPAKSGNPDVEPPSRGLLASDSPEELALFADVVNGRHRIALLVESVRTAHSGSIP